MDTKIAFVDPIISPIYLATELHKFTLKIIAIFTLTNLSEEEKHLRFRPEYFDEVIYLENHRIDEIAQQLKKQNVQYVFYGYEGSVEIADQLAQMVCPEFANPKSTSTYRYNKFAMQEALEENDVPAVKQTLISHSSLKDIGKILQDWNYPVFIKPLTGAASIGIGVCYSLTEVEKSISENEHKLIHSDIVTEYVIQELLTGEEYFVDSFSLSGKHHIVSVNRYEKLYHNGSPIYRCAESVSPTDKIWQLCSDYITNVLNAVNLYNGFGHTEFFINNNNFRLLEVNPRISGVSGFINKMADKVFGNTQVKVMAETILNLKKTTSKENSIHHGRLVMLQNWYPKKIGELHQQLLATLPSFTEALTLKKAGTYVQEPKSLLDTVALVLLTNDNLLALQDDYRRLMQWEKESMLF